MYNIAITGNLAHDLEVRGDAENPQVFFTLIRNEPVRGSDETKPVRYPIGVFGQQAKNFAASARKGDRITAVVRLGNRQQEVHRLRATDDKPTTVTNLTLTATEVGPALTWATANITRNEKRSGDNGSFPEARSAAPAAAKSAPAAAPAAPAAAAAPAMAGAGAPVSDDLF